MILLVAFNLTACLLFCGVVADLGVLWVAKGQVQNAADAGALAGAISLRDNAEDIDGARAAALHFAEINPMIGGAPSEIQALAGLDCPDAHPAACVQVDVHNPRVPVLILTIVGQTHGDVRASATAEGSPAHDAVRLVR